MIFRATALCEDGLRHAVFILGGYPVGSTICAEKTGVKREALDEPIQPITCVRCLSFEHTLKVRLS